MATSFRLKCEGDFASQETEIQCTEESPKYLRVYIPPVHEYIHESHEHVLHCTNYARGSESIPYT